MKERTWVYVLIDDYGESWESPAISVFATKEGAIGWARDIAEEEAQNMNLHNPDGPVAPAEFPDDWDGQAVQYGHHMWLSYVYLPVED